MYRSIETRPIAAEEFETQREITLPNAIEYVASQIRTENQQKARSIKQSKEQKNEIWAEMAQENSAFSNEILLLRDRREVVATAEKRDLPSKGNRSIYSAYRSPFLFIEDPEARDFLDFVATSRLITKKGEIETYKEKYRSEAEIMLKDMGLDRESSKKINLEGVVKPVLQDKLKLTSQPK